MSNAVIQAGLSTVLMQMLYSQWSEMGTNLQRFPRNSQISRCDALPRSCFGLDQVPRGLDENVGRANCGNEDFIKLFMTLKLQEEPKQLFSNTTRLLTSCSKHKMWRWADHSKKRKIAQNECCAPSFLTEGSFCKLKETITG